MSAPHSDTDEIRQFMDILTSGELALLDRHVRLYVVVVALFQCPLRAHSQYCSVCTNVDCSGLHYATPDTVPAYEPQSERHVARHCRYRGGEVGPPDLHLLTPHT